MEVQLTLEELSKDPDQWITELRKAPRSALIRIKNDTSDTLFRTNFVLHSGKWRVFPPEAIEPTHEAAFGSESFGFASGTEGQVQFQMFDGQAPFVFKWDVPYFPMSDPTASGMCGEGYRIGNDLTLKSHHIVLSFAVYDLDNADYPKRKEEETVSVVRLAPKIIESWKLQMQKAQRSILISFSNSSQKYKFLRKSYSVISGIWRMEPPLELLSDSTVDCGAESHGLPSTSGEIVFKIQNNNGTEPLAEANFKFDIPIFGHPTFDSNIFSISKADNESHYAVTLDFGNDEAFVLETRESKHEAL
jgi:hypothetical protein